MQWWEVNDYLEGLRMREHTPWEAARFIAHTVACMFCKGVAKRADQWLPFTWEEEGNKAQLPFNEDAHRKYVNEMRKRIREENEKRRKG